MTRPARLGPVIPKPRSPKPKPAPAPRRPRAIDAIAELDELASDDGDDPLWLDSLGRLDCLIV